MDFTGNHKVFSFLNCFYTKKKRYINMPDNHIPILHQLISNRLMARFGPDRQSLSRVRVLDLGCGRGQQLVYMNGLGFQMSGCDIRRNDVEATLAALNGAESPFTDVRLSKSTTELPFETGRFHGVYANGVFEHCAEMPPLIGEISRVLIPGGVFITAFPLRSVILEPHLKLPIVHWFKKGRMQRLLIRILSHLCNPERNCQSIERYLENDVFYWTSGQIQQILNRHFEQTNSLANEYLRLAEKQVNRNLLLRLGLTITAKPFISPILEHFVCRYWTYVVEARNPIKK